MKEILLSNELKKILSFNEHRRLRYAKELNWFDQWHNLWMSDRIRIGVIGVTSSGKSTLINALLGDELLSVAVRPSSSQLVSCSYAKERSATIYFLNGDKKTIGDTVELKDSVIQYSDENYNKNNQKQVAQLELSTPSFSLGEDVLLVDSPGLDATGYEVHEKLTLETLLPTVDVVIFVTTVKSEVDKKMKQTLDIIAKYNCPVMVVQNMLDAVRPSVDGKKSATTVAKERMNRVLLAIEQSEIKNKNEVKVAQISAINAMKYRCGIDISEQGKKAYDISCYEDFVVGVKDLVKAKRPEIERQRIKTILDYINGLIIQENDRVKNADVSVPVDTVFFSISQNITNALNETYNDIDSVIFELQNLYDKYFSEVDNMEKENGFSTIFKSFFSSSYNKTFGEDDIKEIKETVKRFELNVVESVQDFSSKCSDAIRRLNLPTRDLWSYNGLPRMPEMSVKTKTVKRSRTVKKEGLGRSVLRFVTFGLYKGEETEYYTETVPDDEATKESIKRYIERLQREYAKTLETWQNSANSTVTSIQREIDLRIEAIEEKKKMALDASEWRDTCKALEHCIKQYETQMNKSENIVQDNVFNAPSEPITTRYIKVPRKYIQLYDSAEKYLISVQQSILNFALQVQNRKDYPSIVISNSPDNLSDFLYKFYQGQKMEFEIGKIYNLSNKLKIACAPTESQLENIFEDTFGANVFMLINGLQFHTKFESTLRKSVEEKLNKNDALFLTIQDFEVLANGNAISESLRSIHIEQLETGFGTKGLILINHKNPVYNMAIVHAQITEVRLNDETIFYKNLTSKFPKLVNENVKKHINNILRSFNV